MGLLDNPRHAVSVQLQKRVKGAAGYEYKPDGAPITVRGNLHPMSADGSRNYGLQSVVSQQLNTRELWPGDAHAIVTTSDGRQWDCVGVQEFVMSAETAHREVILKLRVG